jgi:UDP-N-acetylglucosamine 1-carboxyvinyltransferase
MHLAELSRMGADIHVEGRLALIKGGKPLSGALVHATDLRAAAALLLAGLLARGETTLLDDAGHLLRGYDGLDEKLAALGANIRRAEDGPETT